MPVSESLPTALLVKETRKRLGLTQVQFAEELGVSFQSVNRWERNKTKPLPIVLKQIELMVRQMGDRGSDLLEQYFLKGEG
jgi:transcriptional regulator with XRE-family HTH domain